MKTLLLLSSLIFSVESFSQQWTEKSLMSYFDTNKDKLARIEGIWTTSYLGGQSSVAYIIKTSDGMFAELREKDFVVIRTYKTIGTTLVKESNSTDNSCVVKFENNKTFRLEWMRLPGTPHAIKFSGLF